MNKNLLFAAGGVLCIPLLSSCDKLLDALLLCGEACTNIETCGDSVSPPSMDLGIGDFDLGVEAPSVVDCAANCSSESRVTLGYSDCQIECISSETCDSVNECWDVTSPTYSSYCVVDTAPVEAAATEDGSEPDVAAGTTTGSSAADSIIDNPAVEESVAESGTDIFFGSSPPNLEGKWAAVGTIDESRNARPVGSPIDTEVCFFDQTTTSDGSPQLSYCEKGNPSTSTAPLIGDGSGWTMFLEFAGQGSIIFSGEVMDGTTTMDPVDALVTYYHGLDIWEHSDTRWETAGACECPF